MAKFEDRRVIRTPLPPTEEEMERFNEFKDQWEKLLDKGEARGWIDWLPDGGYDLGTPRPGGYAEHEETDEEYETRMNSPWARVALGMSELFLNDLMRSRSLPNHFIGSLPTVGDMITFKVAPRQSGKATEIDLAKRTIHDDGAVKPLIDPDWKPDD